MKYSPRGSVKSQKDGLQQCSIDSMDEVPLLYGEHCFSGKKKLREGSFSLTHSMAFHNASLDRFNSGSASGCGSKTKISRVQSTENAGQLGEPTSQIDMLQQNLDKLAKLERRLMRGRGHRKKSSRPQADDLVEQKTKDTQKKMKKKGKNWRFAYDLYCKEIIISNQHQLNS